MKARIVILLVLFINVMNVYATTWFDDGKVHDVNYVIADDVQIWDDELDNLPTIVNLFSEGYIQELCQVSLNSQLNMYEGTLNNGLSTHDYSQINISGGMIKKWVYSYDNSHVYFSGGETYQFESRDSSIGFISGGKINQPISAHNTSKLIISGGILNDDIRAYGDSMIYIYGGQKASAHPISVLNKAKIVIIGSHFRINDEYYGFGEINVSSGRLTGKLKNEELIDVAFQIYTEEASILLVPEMPTISYCVNYPTMDFNRDCKVDLIDFAEFASQWLTCNLEPQSACQ